MIETKSQKKVPAYILTGFLGAGKTTLLRHLIESTSGQRFTVIVNEFGDMGFDGEIIESCCSDVVELKNGCICCRVGDDLVPTLETILEREDPPHAILIESSGLALPQPVVEAFRFPTIAKRATVAGVVVAVDAPVFDAGMFDDVLGALRAAPTLAPRGATAFHNGGDDPVAEVLEDQLRAADLVILTKMDLLTPARQSALSAAFTHALPADVALACAKNGEVDANTLLSLSASAENALERKPSRHALEGEHEHDEFEGHVFDLGEIKDRHAMQDRVTAAMSRFKLLRVKGFVAQSGRAERFILQATAAATTLSRDKMWTSDAPRTTRLVAIGLKGLDAAAIQLAIQEPA